AVITIFQVRSARRKLGSLHLDKIRISVGADGLAITSPSSTQICPYAAIKRVVARRDRRNGEIKRITVYVEGQRFPLPGLENSDRLIGELRTRLDAALFGEEKG